MASSPAITPCVWTTSQARMSSARSRESHNGERRNRSQRRGERPERDGLLVAGSARLASSVRIIDNPSLSGRSPLRWLRFLRSPLWLCLLLALLIRAWLVVHTQGVIAGDEAMVGLQAENILRGQHPVYYYGQPYMGSLEAYFAALL